jgi:tetratricopeptide (TPR) repeat protein
MAIGDGQFDRAETLIAQGRRLDAANERWSQLTDQLRREREKLKQAQAAQEKAKVVEGYVTRAAELMKNKEYDAAIAAYDKALEVDPNNGNLIASRNTAQIARDQQNMGSLKITQGDTMFFGPEADNRGFQQDDNITVKLGTQRPDSPAELMVEIYPTTVQPGQPYFLRVRVHNKGNKPIGIKGLELISTFGAKTSGRGQELAPRVQRINPRDTSLIWEAQGNWTEDQNHGKVEAIVYLIGKARLEKTISWQ